MPLLLLVLKMNPEAGIAPRPGAHHLYQNPQCLQQLLDACEVALQHATPLTDIQQLTQVQGLFTEKMLVNSC